MNNRAGKRVIFVLLFLLACGAWTGSVAGVALAQDGGEKERSYRYDLIDITIRINADTTFDVEERQVFNYTGEYHQGWRSIPLNKIDAITDVEVIDGKTGEPLEYSRKTLEKTDPASWGKFTHYRKRRQGVCRVVLQRERLDTRMAH